MTAPQSEGPPLFQQELRTRRGRACLHYGLVLDLLSLPFVDQEISGLERLCSGPWTSVWWERSGAPGLVFGGKGLGPQSAWLHSPLPSGIRKQQVEGACLVTGQTSPPAPRDCPRNVPKTSAPRAAHCFNNCSTLSVCTGHGSLDRLLLRTPSSSQPWAESAAVHNLVDASLLKEETSIDEALLGPRVCAFH